MTSADMFVSELSATRHLFQKYHFCRGNSNKRKSRIGIIVKGSGTYIYLNKRLRVSEGDAVFIPEQIYCYSEWHGEPDIEVVYLSCFMHYESFKYEPQILNIDRKIKNDILQIAAMLCAPHPEVLEAYSLFYRLLQSITPKLRASNVTPDKTLLRAVAYITENWNRPFSVSDLSKHCCVSESTLYHLFKRELGQTPIRFLHSVRINVAIEHLENTDHSVASISALVGFRSENHFRRVFADFTGTTPLKYRKGK